MVLRQITTGSAGSRDPQGPNFGGAKTPCVRFDVVAVLSGEMEADLASLLVCEKLAGIDPPPPLVNPLS